MTSKIKITEHMLLSLKGDPEMFQPIIRFTIITGSINWSSKGTDCMLVSVSNAVQMCTHCIHSSFSILSVSPSSSHTRIS